MKKAIFLFLTIFVSFLAQAQTIKGVIIDKQSAYPLIGASVIIADSDPLLGSTTDIDGIFRIENVPLGRYTLRVEYLGYESIVIPNILVSSAKETEVNLQMEESLIQINEVVVSANKTAKGQVTNQLATVSARSICVE